MLVFMVVVVVGGGGGVYRGGGLVKGFVGSILGFGWLVFFRLVVEGGGR